MTQQSYPPTFPPRYPILNPAEKHYINERHSTTLNIEVEQKNKNLGNITSTIGYYPRNG